MSDTTDQPKPATGRGRLEPPDLSEKGGLRNGEDRKSVV